MKTVRDLLENKGHEIWSVKPAASVFDAIKLMDKHKVGGLLVLEKRKLVGIITERDYARKVILKGKSSKQTAVKDIMTREVVYVSPDQTIEECMALMTGKRIRHLPVFDGDKLIGVISIGDVVRATVSDKEFLIEQLTKYIAGA
jgi:CBS domain-containing protein